MSDDELDLRAAEGLLAAEVAEEFPGLRLDWLSVRASDGASAPGLARRLAELSNRERGATVIVMRTKPIPSAYRTFFRQIGLDPDETRIPSEQAALERLFYGAFSSRGLLADALLLALVETGVAVWALDGDRVGPEGLAIRASSEGDLLGAGPQAHPLRPGTLVVCDDTSVHAILFGETAATSAVERTTTQIVLYAVSVPGVPRVHAEEALWLAVEALTSRR